MKLFTLTLVLVGGCSFLDQVEIGDAGYVARDKIYLGYTRVRVSKSEMDRYACESGAPMYCDYAGALWECRCPE